VLKDLLSYFNIASVKLTGVVVSGLSEGAFYISLEGYRRAIEEALGFTPYPGTLNVRLERQSLPYRMYLDSLPGILIPGFSNGIRTYGAVKAFRARIRGVEGAVVMPERTHHPTDVIEVVAPVKLRDVLGLKDGDRIEIEIYL
jgi:riboflavin kinase